MSHSHNERVPKITLLAAGTLIVFAFAATATMRLTQMPPSASPELLRAADHAKVIKTRSLRFIDAPDRGVRIEDVGTGALASTIVPEQETGFIRGVMRGLARERRMHGIDGRPPFTLTEWSDGELSLTDTATGRSIELNAFGTTNRASFAALLTNTETRK